MSDSRDDALDEPVTVLGAVDGPATRHEGQPGASGCAGAHWPQVACTPRIWPDRLKVSRQAVAQGIASLERHGYVTRVTDPVDARARIIELTPRGRQALRVIRSNALDLEKRWEVVLGSQRLRELRESLQMLLSGEADASGD